MSNDVKKPNGKEQNFIKVLGKFIVIYSEGKLNKTNLVIPKTGSYEERKNWLEGNNTVYAIGDEVTKVKVGERVFTNAHKMRRPEELTKLMEELTGVKLTENEGKIDEKDTAIYFTILEEDIVCVINN